jgi:hypothetical protein
MKSKTSKKGAKGATTQRRKARKRLVRKVPVYSNGKIWGYVLIYSDGSVVVTDSRGKVLAS